MSHAGGCLCGAVTYEVAGNLSQTSACHCGQCRRQSGHLWASAQAEKAAVTMRGPVTWYHATPGAKRGFCATCGAFLFWTALDETTISVSLGSLDAPTGLTLERHIFCADKGDYYEITDGLPQSP